MTDAEAGEGDLGYVVHRDFWSRGYATEAAKILLQFGFDELSLRWITATCGMQPQGGIPAHLVVGRSARDSPLFACVTPDRPNLASPSRSGPGRDVATPPANTSVDT